MNPKLSEFDPVVSILMREWYSFPPYAGEINTDEKAHNWIRQNDPAFYGGLLHISSEIRNSIYQEVDSALWTNNDDAEQEIYNAAIDDCLRIIETRGKGPI